MVRARADWVYCPGIRGGCAGIPGRMEASGGAIAAAGKKREAMQLTQRQEALIARRLREMGAELDSGLAPAARQERLREIQLGIYRELERLQRPALSDEDVLSVLRRPPRGDVRVGASAPGPISGAVWLGVCAHNAARFGAEPWMARAAAFALGLLVGPLALFCYLAGYAEWYFNTPTKARPAIDWLAVARRSAGPIVALVLLRWGGGKAESLISYGYERIAGGPVPPLGSWAWLQFYEGAAFYLVFLSVLPLGVLSGLPLANAWGHSLKRLAQALVALYGVLVCFGLASILAGVILDRVEVYLQ